MNRHNVIINGLKVAYWSNDINYRQTIVLLHGLGGDHRGLMEFASHFPDYRIIIPDLPGWGESEPLIVEHNLVNYAQFVHDLRQELNVSSLIIIGHSFGGTVAATYATLFPLTIDKIVLLNPVLDNPPTLALYSGKLYFKFVSFFPDRVSHFLLCNKMIVYLTDIVSIVTTDKKIKKRILTQDYENYRQANIRTIQQSFQTLNNVRLILFKKIKSVNLFIILCDHDRLLDKKYNLKLINFFKQATIKIVPGGHLLPFEEPLMTANIIHHFLE